jgi:hypothetical protein
MKLTLLLRRANALPAAPGEIGGAVLEETAPARVLSEAELDHVVGAGGKAGGVVGSRAISF